MTTPIASSCRWARPLIGAIAALCIATAASAGAPQQKGQAPGWYRLQLGEFEVTALNDGALRVDPKLLQNITPKELAAALDRTYQTAPMVTSVNAFLINTGSKLVLVDTGAGALSGPTVGQLVSNLKAAGYQPDQVDDILITHMHGDHLGGIALDGKMSFPNATIHVDKRESDHWLSKENLEKAPAAMKAFYQGPQTVAAPYVAAGKWQPYETEAEIVPGIKPVSYGPIPGHTPGHEGYLVESGGEKLLVWGDIVHFAAAQFAKPTITIAYDSDPKHALQTREKLFAQLAKDRTLVAAAHISFPGLGHVRKEGTAYAWVPVIYQPASSAK